MRAKRRINYKKGGHKYRTEKKIKGCNERDRKTDRTKKRSRQKIHDGERG